jgi:hypothetical protein
MKRKRAAPRLTDNQKELREGRLKELRQLHGGRLTRKEKEEFEALTDKEQEMRLGVSRSFNFHMEMGEWLAVQAYRAERSGGLRSANENKQRKAERDYQEYRDIAGTLIAENPQLRRATRYGLAKRVQAELVKRGNGVVSARTIWNALPPKNKVWSTLGVSNFSVIQVEPPSFKEMALDDRQQHSHARESRRTYRR